MQAYNIRTIICINFVRKIFVQNFRVTIFSFTSNVSHIFAVYSIISKKNSHKKFNFRHFVRKFFIYNDILSNYSIYNAR